MKIIITANEAIDLGIWDNICATKGISLFAVNEGMISGDAEITLNEKEAAEFKLVKKTE